MCNENSKIASFGRFIMPIVQGAAAGAASVGPPRVGGGSGFGQSFFSGFGAGSRALQQQALLKREMANEDADRNLKMATTNQEMNLRQAQLDRIAEERNMARQRHEAVQKLASPSGSLLAPLGQLEPNEQARLNAGLLGGEPKDIISAVDDITTGRRTKEGQPTHYGDIVSVEDAQKAYPDLAIPPGAKFVRVGLNRQNKAVSAQLAPEPKSVPSLFGKMTPEMASIGVPPDFRSYPGGAEDPQFQKDVQEYGKKVVALKQKMAVDVAETRGIGYAKGRALYTPFAVIDTQNDMSLDYVPAMSIINQPSRYLPAGPGATQQMKNAIIGDIQGASKLLRDAYKKLDVPFNADQRAALTLALSSDPTGASVRGVVSALGIGTARGQFTPAQADVVIATGQAVENAYALRTVAGFGQGSDELRNAIRATLPGAGTPSREYALKQLDAFDAQVGRLAKGIPKAPIRGEKPSARERVRVDEKGNIIH